MQETRIQAAFYLQVASDAHPGNSSESATRLFISVFIGYFYFSVPQLYEFCMAVAKLHALKPTIKGLQQRFQVSYGHRGFK